MTVLRVAHRAGNDLERLVVALDGGADLVEADVHLHRGRLEVRHTKSLGPLPWLWDKWYLVRADAPRLQLRALAEAVPSDRRLMLDLKGWQPSLGRRVAAAMAEAVPDLPYVVCSRHWRMLDAFADLEHVDVVHSVRSRAELARLTRRLARRKTWGVAVHRELLPRMDIEELLRTVPALLTWPVNTPEVLEEVVGHGVTHVISDDL